MPVTVLSRRAIRSGAPAFANADEARAAVTGGRVCIYCSGRATAPPRPYLCGEVNHMCSISGVMGGDMRPMERLKIAGAMNEALAHRGPDQNGIYFNGEVALAHNRLSVIDPANGRQPMTRTDGRGSFTILYNGELYNTAELRRELTALGYIFETNCDTEALLYAYMAWGEGCLPRLNGIFAFVVYDEGRRALFLARDRLGVKPLFWAQAHGALVFASEIKALFRHPGIRPRVSREGLWQVVFLLPARIPGTGVFRGVEELQPGWCLEYTAEGGVKAHAYWQLQAHEHTESPADTVAHVRELVRDSIVRQLVSDVPLCALLSGGLDSSAICAVAAEHLRGRGELLDTYSFEYEDNRLYFKETSFQPNSDDEYAAYVAEQIGSRHTVLTAGQRDIAALLDSAVDFRDLPGQADVDSSLLYYCRQIKGRHTVGLSGECADEIFGGYPWFRSPPEELAGFPWLYSPGMRAQLFRPDAIHADDGVGWTRDVFRRSVQDCPALPGETGRELVLRQTAYLSMMYFMHQLLERKDRMSMASALEVRVPFADHRIAEYVYNIPWGIKQRDGVEKAVLRDAMQGIVPDRVLTRRKSPYPKTHNPVYEQIVTAKLNERLRDPHSALHALLRAEVIGDLNALDNITWFGQLMGRPQLIAYLLQLDHWFTEYRVELVD